MGDPVSDRCDECHLAGELHQHGCSKSDVSPDVSEICMAAEDVTCICHYILEGKDLGIQVGFDRGLNAVLGSIRDLRDASPVAAQKCEGCEEKATIRAYDRLWCSRACAMRVGP